ncbi:FtsX-like permease family protein [Ornithinimicrobium cryptoxanthini]|uniref:FtsX-like permease family protein n=1 Tax=Ornithinimicrobium cryptoxanthini TaxID=2934161 RepID=A0ABY4YJ19_9MICO|nr:FtsX-like permease family protein [Ornithinimicrobium cryptoxanthini]USQ76152.1 FtsX-like permease family protein [Ornithinimicrobium cryptoxanthini]
MSTASLAVSGLRGHARRLAATALAIVLSVAFVATTMLMLDALERGVGESVAGDFVNRDLVVRQTDGTANTAGVDALRAADGITVVDASARVPGTIGNDGAIATTAPRGPGVALQEGALPTGPDQVVVSSVSAATVGDTVTFQAYEYDGTQGAAVDLEVVGVMDVGNAPELSWSEVLVVDEATLRGWDPELIFDHVTVDLSGADESAARATIGELLPGAEVLTGQEAANLAVAQATGGLDLLGPVLLGFGAIAVATSALVIANTFAIVLTQRTRELALLRCVGATRSQVRRTVLTEAGLLGAAASTAGVLLAVAVTWTAASLLGEIDLGTPMTLRPGLEPVSLAVPWVVGVAVTVAAAWWPTRRATRVAPMAALQPVTAPDVVSRPGLVRILASVLLLGAGAAGLVLAASTGDVVIGVAAGLVSFIGVLVAAVFFVPAGIRALGAALRGVPSRLAVGNTVANPGRAAATSAALLIGVTLITMTSVGAASAERTAMGEIDQQYPADVMAFPQFELTGSPSDEAGEQMVVEALNGAVFTQVAGVAGVAEAVEFGGGWLQVESADGTWSAESPVYGIDPTAVAPVLRDAGAVERLQPGTVGMSEWIMEINGLELGDAVQLSGPDGSSEATVVAFPMDEFVLPAADLAALDASSAAGGGLLLRLSDDADVATVVADIRDIVEPEGAWVTGGAPARAQLTTMLDVLVLITTALLGVAVVIAVVGIANTLALSVLERTRENSLLRAMGLTRAQLRGMLTVEGVLLAVVSALLGIGLGVTYAWFGVQTLMPDGTDTVLAFPLTRLVVILAVALGAGLLASVLPARRAARVAPAAGLATA